MDNRARGVIGLIGSLILCVYGTYHIFSPSAQAVWTSWLLAIAGILGMIGGVRELKESYKNIE